MAEVMVSKAEVKALEGDKAVAEAMRQINPDVVAAYPVTPQTEIVMEFSQFVAEGLVDTEFIPVESEFAAMSSCIGASCAGARAMSATCGPGLELMWEMFWVASGLRCPIVMAVVNRSHAAPLNILTDQTDMMGSRDTGWVQIYAENHQEVYDNFIQAVRIAEHPDILLPIMCGHAGFVLGHTLGRVEVLPDEVVKNFVGEYKPLYSLLDIEHPKTFGAYDHWDYFFEHRRQVFEAINNALRVIPEIGQEYGKISGRYYGLVEPYRLDDADVVIMIIGSGAGACREAVDEMREKGTKAGMLKVRCFRPFPAEEVVKALKDKKAVAVMDRCACFGAEGGPLFIETGAAFFNRGLPMKLIDYFYGLGGRDTVPSEFCDIFYELSQIAETGEIKPPLVRYLAVRE